MLYFTKQIYLLFIFIIMLVLVNYLADQFVMIALKEQCAFYFSIGTRGIE